MPFGERGDFEQCQTEQTSGKKFVWDWLGKNGVKSQAQLEEATRQKLPFAVFATQCIPGDLDWAVAAYCLKAGIKLYEEEQLAHEKCVKAGERPTIGMTYEQAVATCWGKPETINRTITEGHVRVQAVYADHQRYLNFDDGVLTSIGESGAAP